MADGEVPRTIGLLIADFLGGSKNPIFNVEPIINHSNPWVGRVFAAIVILIVILLWDVRCKRIKERIEREKINAEKEKFNAEKEKEKRIAEVNADAEARIAEAKANAEARIAEAKAMVEATKVKAEAAVQIAQEKTKQEQNEQKDLWNEQTEKYYH